MSSKNNSELLAALRAGTATARDRRLYAMRVRQRKYPLPCERGHFGCALVKYGPCRDEVLRGVATGRRVR